MTRHYAVHVVLVLLLVLLLLLLMTCLLLGYELRGIKDFVCRLHLQ